MPPSSGRTLAAPICVPKWVVFCSMWVTSSPGLGPLRFPSVWPNVDLAMCEGSLLAPGGVVLKVQFDPGDDLGEKSLGIFRTCLAESLSQVLERLNRSVDRLIVSAVRLRPSARERVELSLESISFGSGFLKLPVDRRQEVNGSFEDSLGPPVDLLVEGVDLPAEAC